MEGRKEVFFLLSTTIPILKGDDVVAPNGGKIRITSSASHQTTVYDETVGEEVHQIILQGKIE